MSGHSNFLRKKIISLGNKVDIFNIFVVRAVTCWYALFTCDAASKIGLDSSKSYCFVQYMQSLRSTPENSNAK